MMALLAETSPLMRLVASNTIEFAGGIVLLTAIGMVTFFVIDKRAKEKSAI